MTSPSLPQISLLCRRLAAASRNEERVPLLAALHEQIASAPVAVLVTGFTHILMPVTGQLRDTYTDRVYEATLRCVVTLTDRAPDGVAKHSLPAFLSLWEVGIQIIADKPVFAENISSSNNNNDSDDVGYGEEVVIAALELLRALLNALANDHDTGGAGSSSLTRLSQATLRPLWGFSVSSLMQRATHHRYRDISVRCVNVLQAFLRLFPPQHHPVAWFVPGVAGGLLKLICSDYKRGTLLVVAAIDAWDAFWELLLSDSTLASFDATLVGTSSSPSSSSSSSSSSEAMMTTLQQLSVQTPPSSSHSADDAATDATSSSVPYTHAWLAAARRCLLPLLQRVYPSARMATMVTSLQTTTMNHTEHWNARIRTRLVRSAATLLRTCGAGVLGGDGVALVANYVVASCEAHDMPSVQSAATDTMMSLRTLPWFDEQSQRWMDSVLTQWLGLPRVMRGGLAADQVSALRTLLGTMKVVDAAQLQSLWLTHFDRLATACLQAMEVNVSNTHSLEHKTSARDNTNIHYLLELKAAQNDLVTELMYRCCTTLGYTACYTTLVATSPPPPAAAAGVPAPVVTVSVFDMWHRWLRVASSSSSSSSHESTVCSVQQLALVYVVNALWRGVRQCVEAHGAELLPPRRQWWWRYYRRLMYDVVGIVLDPCRWDVPTRPSSTLAWETTLRHETGVSLFIRTIDELAHVLYALLPYVCATRARDEVEPFVMRCLFPVLEKIGAPCLLVSHTARVTAHHMAHCFYHDDDDDDDDAADTDGAVAVKLMVAENADFLVDTMCAHLRHSHATGGSEAADDGNHSLSKVPRLLTVLLGQVDAGTALLPLLDDVLQLVLNTLSMQFSLHLHVDPATTRAYLHVLLAIVNGVGGGDDADVAAKATPQPHDDDDDDDDDDNAAPAWVKRDYYTSATAVDVRRVEFSKRLEALRRLQRMYPDNAFLALAPIDKWMQLDISPDDEFDADADADGGDGDGDGDGAQADDDDEEEKKVNANHKSDDPQPASREELLLVKVLMQCNHLLTPPPPSSSSSSSSHTSMWMEPLSSDEWTRHQTLVLTVMKTTICNLAPLSVDTEHEKGQARAHNELLPALAKVWPAFVCTLSDQHTVVPTDDVLTSSAGMILVKTSVDVLHAILSAGDGMCAGFMSRRFVADVWPPLQRCMTRLTATMHSYLRGLPSSSPITAAVVQGSLNFQVQLRIARCVGAILAQSGVRVPPSVVDEMVALDVTVIRVSPRSEAIIRPLSNAMLRWLRVLAYRDIDTVWYHVGAAAGGDGGGNESVLWPIDDADLHPMVALQLQRPHRPHLVSPTLPPPSSSVTSSVCWRKLHAWLQRPRPSLEQPLTMY